MAKNAVFDGNSFHGTPVSHPVNNPCCAFYGTDSDRAVAVPFNAELLSQHIMFLGGIGTGKTNAIFQLVKQLRQTMTTDDVMIVFDTKGDFHKEFYSDGDIVISNDDNSTGAYGKDYWNIFSEIERGKHMQGNIVEITKTLFHDKSERTNQPFFPNAAKDLLSAIMTHFIESGDISACNNKSLRKFLDSSPTQQIREMLQGHEEFKSMVSYIFDDRSPQTQGVFSELQQVSRSLFLENFAEIGTLSMRNLVREKGGRVVFVEYDMGIGNMLSPVYSLLFDMAIKEALSRDNSGGNVFFVVDEFSLIPNLQHIDDAVNFGRSQGVKFMVGIQNVDQMFDNYGEQRARSLLSGFLTSVAFRVNDVHSKDFIKERHGRNRKKESYVGASAGRGMIENIRDANVVEDWDISRLTLGQAIIGLPGQEPFLFQFDKA
jgi:type IV secretory pathway TraG/TraD family ATPase VirD4